MKKILLLLVSAALLGACTQDRDHVLKVYNWSDYMDLTVIPEFEEWYEQQTGEKVKVIVQTFDINETMLSKIEKGHEDYDVVCPSEYIIERMLHNDLLLPIGDDFGDTPNYIKEYVSPYVRTCFDKLDCGGKNANDYAVGYMWGTVGLIYNAKYVTAEEVSTWNVLRNPKFDGKIFLKDSARDMFCQIIIYLHRDDLASGKITVDELMLDSSDEAIAEVEAFLKDAAKYAAGWEADFGKDQLVQERGWISVNWSGDGVWSRDQAAPLGVDLRFALPEEGYTMWFDGWVIPKYARNPQAARYFINFMNRPDIVVRNMEFTGYVSTSAAPEVLEAFIDDQYDPIDLSYFFGPEADSVTVDPVLYPDRSVIEKGGLEHDWGERTPLLVEMWSRVKGDNANWVTVAVVSVFLVALLAFAILSRRSRNRKHRRK